MKSVFQYGILHSIDKLNNAELLPKEVLYSKLKQERVTNDEYNKAKNCWKETKCKIIKDLYCNLS